MWKPILTPDDLPKKPGVASYEHVECLIFHNGDVKIRMWNCEHLVWDDDEGDDFFCLAMEPLAYMPIPRGQDLSDACNLRREAERSGTFKPVDISKD